MAKSAIAISERTQNFARIMKNCEGTTDHFKVTVSSKNSATHFAGKKATTTKKAGICSEVRKENFSSVSD